MAEPKGFVSYQDMLTIIKQGDEMAEAKPNIFSESEKKLWWQVLQMTKKYCDCRPPTEAEAKECFDMYARFSEWKRKAAGERQGKPTAANVGGADVKADTASAFYEAIRAKRNK